MQELSRLKGNSRLSEGSQQMQDRVEAIMAEQGAKLLGLEEENAGLRRQLRDLSAQLRNQSESHALRLKNV